MAEELSLKLGTRTETIIVINEIKGEVSFPGFDWGNGSRPLLIVAQTRQTITIKIPGASHWAPMGSQAYVAAQYRVYAVLERTTDTHGRVKLAVIWLTGIPVRSTFEAYWAYRQPIS